MSEADPEDVGAATRLARWGPRLVVAAFAIAIFAAWQAGLYADFSVESLRARILDAGSLGALLFIPIFVLGGLLHMPALVFPMAAGLIWPLPIALAVSWVGASLNACIMFSIARYTVRGAVERRLPEGFRALDELIGENGLRSVILFRLITFVGSGPQWVLGATRVELRDVLIGTPIGVIPWVVLLTALGSYEMSWQTRLTALVAIAVVSGAMATVAVRRAASAAR